MAMTESKTRVEHLISHVPRLLSEFALDVTLTIGVVSDSPRRRIKMLEAMGIEQDEESYLLENGLRNRHVHIQPIDYSSKEQPALLRGRTRLMTLVDSEIYPQLIAIYPPKEITLTLGRGHISVAHNLDMRPDSLFIPVDVRQI